MGHGILLLSNTAQKLAIIRFNAYTKTTAIILTNLAQERKYQKNVLGNQMQ